MPLDTLICGLCEETFTDLNDFVVHKQTGCTSSAASAATERQRVVVVVKQEEDEEAAEQQLQRAHQVSDDASLNGAVESVSVSVSVTGTQQHEQRGGVVSVPMHLAEAAASQISKLSSQHEGDCDSTRADAGDLAFLDDVHTMEAELGLVDHNEDNDRAAADVGDGDSSATYVILKDAVVDFDPANADGGVKMESAAFAQLEGSELEVLSASQLLGSSSSGGNAGTTTVVISQEEFEAILNKQQGQHHMVVPKDLPAKKPRVGRAKKGEGKNQILEAVPPSTPRPAAPQTNADGKLECPQCKRTFTKERHFNTHKCLASSSYVDISKRDVVKIDSGDEDDEEVNLYLDVDDGAQDDENDREFSAPMEESQQVEREDAEDDHEMDKDEETEEYRPGGDGDRGGVGGAGGVGVNIHDGNGDDIAEPTPKRRKVVRRRGRPCKAKANLEDKPLESGSNSQIKQAVEAMENLPIFKNEEDKVAFEACIDVDLSQVDHMFRIHVIEQELNNTSGVVYNTPTVSSLSVYSCTVCEKIFKSLSHIRLHCITHTDLKPFKCNKCDYTTNSKGNLYTHMRKHTGQYYRCDQCDFKTVNKSHLVEHQMTHDSRRPTCLLCNKDYSTIKSMINHIRKYHTNKAGKEYLATFLSGRGQKGNAIIHQCSICNRKFKKRIDRDRHLFIHDIKDLPNVQMCELCDYWASRKVYLDKHYSKHRVIYCCVICDSKFLSVTRLSAHLTTEHCSADNDVMFVSDSLLQECINKSFYLPEPMATTVEGSKYVNLPTVLTDSGQGHQQQEQEEEGVNQQQQHLDTEMMGAVCDDPTLIASPITKSDNPNASHEDTNDGFSPKHDDSTGVRIREGEKLLQTTTTDESSSNLAASSDMVVVGMGNNNDIVVSSASSSSADAAAAAAFPFSSEYRDLIQGAAGVEEEEDGGISNLKTEEGMMILIPSPNGTLTDTDNSAEVVACLQPGGDLATKGEEESKLHSLISSASQIQDKEIIPGDEGGQALTESSNSEVLMLQNPGSDTEEKEEDGIEMEVEEEGEEGNDGSQQQHQHQDASGDLEEEGEVTPLGPPLDGDDKDENEELDTVSPGENGVDKDNDQKGDIAGMEGSSGGDGMKGEEGAKENKIQAIIDKMGYRKMTFDIFNKMRETFGTEECEYCGRLFYNKVDHETHLRTHTGDKPFACSHCSFRSTTRDGLRRHSEKEHEKIAYQCKECDFLAPTRTRLWNHQLKHLGITGLSCSQCPEKFDSMKQLRAHMLNSHQDMEKEDMEKLTGYTRRPQGKMGRRSFKCPHCPRVFIRANSELQKHIWIHEGIKPFACPLCKYACRSKNNLQAHMLRHSAEKPFSCSECGKEYKSKTALRWHVRSHKSGKLFKCDKCPYEATQSSHLKRHMEIHDVMKRFVCKHCKFSANTLGYMKIHYAKHHKGQPFIHEESVPPKDGVPNKGVYKCLSCGYLFGNLSDLKRHLKVRHHIQMQDIAGMDQMNISEVEVVQFDDTAVVMGNQPLPDIQQVQHVQQVLQPSQVATTGDFQLQPQDPSGGTMPVSTANLIQQIFGMNQGDNQQVRVVSEDGQPLDISQDTIILQQDGQLLMTTANEMPAAATAGLLPGNQYIIQYFNPGEMPQESVVMGDNPTTSAIQQQPVVSVASPDQISLVQTVGGVQQAQQQLHPHQHQPSEQQTATQFIITSPDGEAIAAAPTPAQLTTQQVVAATPIPTSAAITNGEQQQHQHQPTSSSVLNNSVNHQFIMTAPSATSVGVGVSMAQPHQQPQLISIDGQTHQILTAATAVSGAAVTTTVAAGTTIPEHSGGDANADNIVVVTSDSGELHHHPHHHPIISAMVTEHQPHDQLDTSQELLSVVGEVGGVEEEEEGTQYITSDVDAYSTQLIISDRGGVVGEGGVDLVSGSDDTQDEVSLQVEGQ